MPRCLLRPAAALWATLLLLFTLAALPAHAQDAAWRAKLDPALVDAGATSRTLDFFVRLDVQADLAPVRAERTKAARGAAAYDRLQRTARRSQAGVVGLLERAGADYRPYWISNVVWVRGPLRLAEALAQRPEVAAVYPDGDLRAVDPVDEEAAGKGSLAIEWNLQQVGADDVWALGYTGQGIVVGGQDTGYEWTHNALRDQYRGWNGATADHNYNWHDAIREIDDNNTGQNPCGLDLDAPCDDDGHGTHTMGTLAGDDGGSNQIGMAPDARWIGCRNMERGWGKLSTYLECFEWFLAPTDLNGENPDPAQAPHVINNSWSCPTVEGCNTSNFADMQAAVEALRAAGVVVVVSAGNSGPGCSSVSTPAAIFDASYSVGSTGRSDGISFFSSRGPVTVDGSGRMKPDISAPGEGIRSAYRGGGYASLSGTSMAGPHVAGLVALILSANPDLAGDVDAIEQIINDTALPRTTSQSCGGVPGSQVPNNTYGYGRIDALAAVQAALGGGGSDLTVTATPIGAPIVVPPGGGTFDYEVEIGNAGSAAATFDAWVDIDGPGGVGVTNGPKRLTLGAGQTVSRVLTQAVPSGAPAGTYTVALAAGTYPSADVTDSFTFTKADGNAVASSRGGAAGAWTSNFDAFAAETEVPATLALEANYPNPFNPTTTIAFTLPEAGEVTLRVFDALGRQVRTLVDGRLGAGPQTAVWDATDDQGRGVASGFYVYRLDTDGGSLTRQMVLVK